MKVFLVARGCPDTGDPQWGNFELDQAKALRNMGHQVTILYVDGRFHKSIFKEFGFHRHTVDGIEYFGIFLYPGKLALWLGIQVLVKLKEKQLEYIFSKAVKIYGKPDVIYAHYLGNIACSIKLKKKFNVPVIGIEHWSKLNKEELTEDVRYMGSIAYKGVDKLISVSESLRNRIREHFGVDSTVVNNMVGEDFFEQEIMANQSNGIVKLVSVGSLIQRKGYDLLVEALHLLPKNYSWSLTIIGDGEDKVKLQGMVKEYDLEDRIHFVGKKYKNEIIEIMHNSNAFVLASRAETFGVVYIEALSQGLPVIATSCGGPEEFVNDKNGILIPTDNVKVLKEALETMLEKMDTYDKCFIAEECKRKFSPQVIGKKVSDILGGVKFL